MRLPQLFSGAESWGFSVCRDGGWYWCVTCAQQAWWALNSRGGRVWHYFGCHRL